MKQVALGVLAGIMVASLTLLPHRTITAQGSWHVASVRPIYDLVKEYSLPTRVFFAPDGRQVAYGGPDDQICTLDLVSLDERCLALDRELAYSFPNNDFYPPLSWSPDSTKLALVGLPLQYFSDTDLGIVDVPSMTFTNLSDDGYSGRLVLKPESAGADIETQPVFSSTGQLAVERSQITPEGNAGESAIAVVDLASGDIREVAPLPGHDEYETDIGSVVGMDWSPDGSTLAVSLRHRILDPVYDGIWLLGVASGEWTRLVTPADGLVALRTIYPDTYEDAIQMLAPIRWSPDGSRLSFWAGDIGNYAGHLWGFWIDLATGDISAIPVIARTQDGPDELLPWPFQAAWSPDGSALLVAFRLVTPPSPGDEIRLDPASEEVSGAALYVIDMASQAATLLGHVPMRPAPSLVAVWTPGGSVIAGGYSFTLTRD